MMIPIIEFFIQNYNSNGSIVATETRFHTVPFKGAPPINEPKVKNEMGKAGSFEFSMEMTSPYYDALLQMKTIIRITYFGHTIFRGRVLTIDKTMERKRTVHCEGDFAFLLDSHQIGTEEKKRPEIGVLEYLQQIITQHNSDQSGDSNKQFVLGEVPGQYTSATPSAQRVVIPNEKAKQKFGDTSWNTSMDRIEDLLSNFGGFFRTRYDLTNPSNPVVYLDWYDKYYNSTVSTQTIEVAKNLIDISGPTEVDNLFTILVPIGKADSKNVYISDYWPIVSSSHAKVNYITVPELASVPLYTDAELNSGFHRKIDYQNAIIHFGKIWKPLEFENADTPEKLFAYAKDWMKNNFMPEITQWSVSALDMKFVDGTKQVLLCGDRVNMVHPEVDQTFSGLTIISAEYDLYNPDKNKYTIGIPNQMVNAAYGVKKNKGGGGGGGGISQQNNERDDGLTEEQRRIKEGLEAQYYYKTVYNRDIGLDDPNAYLVYNTDGTEKTKEEIMKDFGETITSFVRTKATKGAELLTEALRRGCSVDDPQLLIDYTPSEKTKQTKWKNDSEYYFENTLGVPMQTANVLLNESDSDSWLASLVDDNGDWTQDAYSRGVTIWDGAANIKEMAVNTRKILQGEKESPGLSIFNGAMDHLSIGNIDIGGYVSSVVDESLKQFSIEGVFDAETSINAVSGLATKGINYLDGLFAGLSEEKNKTSGVGTWIDKGLNFLGGLFTGNNTEDGKKEFSLSSWTASLIGSLTNGGSVTFGSSSHNGKLDGWDVAINKPITYSVTDPSTGTTQSYTVPAKSLAADDMHFTAKYDSLRANLAVVDTLLADYAQITSLVSMNARIGTIEADYITADDITATRIQATIGTMNSLIVNGLSSQGGISAQGNLSCGGTLTVNGHTMYVAAAAVSSDGTVLTITMTNGTSINFTSGGAYINGWNDCIAAATPVTRYTRNTGTYGGDTVHYILQYGNYANVGSGWYKTSRADAYTLPHTKP